MRELSRGARAQWQHKDECMRENKNEDATGMS